MDVAAQSAESENGGITGSLAGFVGGEPIANDGLFDEGRTQITLDTERCLGWEIGLEAMAAPCA